MEKLNSEDGQLFIKNLASFVRTHEKALANALQLQRQPPKHAHGQASHAAASPPPSGTTTFSSTSSTLAAALSFGALKFTSQNIKPAKLTLTPHHLFYLLSRFEELSISVGPMNIRLENIHTETMPSYVSFLNKPQRPKGDRDSIHSVSSARSVMSGMSVLWSSIGLGSGHSTSRSEKARAALEADLKYLYSAFTKIPCLRLAPDHRARLISGYEEFPFDTAVPLHSFKNLSALEIIDVDFRSFYGWDRLSEQLRTLTIKRAHIEDPADLLTGIVLDDIDKRRRRSSKSHASPVLGWSGSGNVNVNANPQAVQRPQMASSVSAPGSPIADPGFGSSASPQATSMMRGKSDGPKLRPRAESNSPTRPTTAKNPGHHTRPHRSGTASRIRRTGSGSSNSSDNSSSHRTGSSSNLVAGLLPPSKWRFLRHLGLPDNALTSIPASSLLPVANTLHSLDLSSNLLTEVPDSLAALVALRALNLSHCMIASLHSLSRNPLPAITALNLRGNRLHALAGVERLLSLERLDLRDNNLSDPTEIARLTNLPEIREIWVKGNPFVKTHPSYRVVIFNLFRRTPGYFEDIIIDGSGPGYSERKQLVDRAAEPEGAPVIRPVVRDDSPVVVTHRGPPQVPIEGSAVSPSSTGHLARDDGAQVGTGSRRKKVLRRKIVDLSSESPRSSAEISRPRVAIPASVSSAVAPTQLHHPPPPRTLLPAADDPFISTTTTSTSITNPHRGPRKDGSSLVDPAPATAPRPEPPASRPAPLLEMTMTRDDKSGDRLARGGEWQTTTTGEEAELCRQQIEALQQQFGAGWLTLLGDLPTGSGADHPPPHHHHPHPVGAHCTPSASFSGHTLPVHPGPAILSGRTLG